MSWILAPEPRISSRLQVETGKNSKVWRLEMSIERRMDIGRKYVRNIPGLPCRAKEGQREMAPRI